MRGHSELMYAEMVLMGIGGLLMFTGDFMNGLIIFGVGAAIHFGMGGFATGF